MNALQAARLTTLKLRVKAAAAKKGKGVLLSPMEVQALHEHFKTNPAASTGTMTANLTAKSREHP